jgi:hypothetical protein
MKKERKTNTSPTADRGGLRWQKHPTNQLTTDAKKRREAIENDATHAKNKMRKKKSTKQK